jgi:glycosyltransferase involved in cell wall biosynthesis
MFMIIGVDGNEANVKEQVGVSVYTLNLLEHFRSVASAEQSFNVFLRQQPMSHMPEPNEFFTYTIVTGPVLWSQIFLPLHLFFRSKIDVFFAPAHYVPRYCPAPIAVTIHDVSYFYFPNDFLKKDLYKLQNWTKRAIQQAKRVISVSKNTKKDIMKFYDVPEEKITVVYNGFEKKDIEEDDAKHRKAFLESLGILNRQFLLYVGTLQPRKNVTLLIQSFEQLVKKNPSLKLVLVGKKGWLYESIFQTVREKGLEKQVVFTGFIPDDQVVTLYKHALCFVMPSLYEGFGIPILEAMAKDCPVVSSFSSSLPEIGGEAGLYFDPTSVEGLTEEVQHLIDTPSLRAEVIKKGKQRIKQFSWKTCAEQTLLEIKKAA